MGVFKYSALNEAGATVKGTYQAADKSTVVSMIKSKGYIPLEVKEKGLVNLGNFDKYTKGKATSRDIAVFCRQFSNVIEAGIPILECLDIIRKQTESKRLKEILNKTYEHVQKGRTLSDSLKEYRDELPAVLINMIESGETSGTLDKVMARLAIHFANEGNMMAKIKGALIYPAVICIVMVLAVIVLIWFVVPQFAGIFASTGSTLPLPTRMLMSAGDFMSKYWFLVIAGLAAAIYGLTKYYKSASGKKFFDNLFLRLPIIGTAQKKIIAARFTRTMSSLMMAGLPLIQALEITDKVINNTVMTKCLTDVIEEVSKGTKLSIAISNIEFLPPMVFNMVNIGEESGALDSILDKTAEFFEEETNYAIEGLMKLIEPVIIVLMAVVVGGIIISIVMPMFDMFKAIQQ